MDGQGQIPNDSEDGGLDPDIASLALSEAEKWGLQIYRNYTRSFETEAITKFLDILDGEALDLDGFKTVMGHIAFEDLRLLPIIVCAFGDRLLKVIIDEALPKKIPGGARLHSNLSSRISLAFAFDMLSQDLAQALDSVRLVRNDIPHGWDLSKLREAIISRGLADLHPTENYLIDMFPTLKLPAPLTPEQAFRIRLLSLTGRLQYEAAAYSRAKALRLRPYVALYGERKPKWLTAIAGEISVWCAMVMARPYFGVVPAPAARDTNSDS